MPEGGNKANTKEYLTTHVETKSLNWDNQYWMYHSVEGNFFLKSAVLRQTNTRIQYFSVTKPVFSVCQFTRTLQNEQPHNLVLSFTLR